MFTSNPFRKPGRCLWRPGRLTTWALCWGLLTVSLTAQPDTAPLPSERQVKAAYIFNFGRFIVWPDPARRDPDAAFAIGVLGDNLLASEMRQLLRDRTIRDQPIRIRQVVTPNDLDGLSILVVGDADLVRWTPALTDLRSRPVLLVGSRPEFARELGHIGFYVEDQRVRFAINPAALRRSDLQASSRLLALALIVNADPLSSSPSP